MKDFKKLAEEIWKEAQTFWSISVPVEGNRQEVLEIIAQALEQVRNETRNRTLDEVELVLEMHRGAAILDGEPQRDPIGTLKCHTNELRRMKFEDFPSVKAGYWDKLHWREKLNGQ
jgi:hypothetical protein